MIKLFQIQIYDISLNNFIKYLCHEEENLHGTDEGESREKSHGASDSGQHVNKFGYSVLRGESKESSHPTSPYPLYAVEGGGSYGDLNKLKIILEFEI